MSADSPVFVVWRCATTRKARVTTHASVEHARAATGPRTGQLWERSIHRVEIDTYGIAWAPRFPEVRPDPSDQSEEAG